MVFKKDDSLQDVPTGYEEDLPLATLTDEASMATKGTLLAACVEASSVIAEIARGAMMKMVNDEARPYTRLQFDAAKYTLEYALGKPTADGAKDPWEGYLQKLQDNDEAPGVVGAMDDDSVATKLKGLGEEG